MLAEYTPLSNPSKCSPFSSLSTHHPSRMVSVVSVASVMFVLIATLPVSRSFSVLDPDMLSAIQTEGVSAHFPKTVVSYKAAGDDCTTPDPSWTTEVDDLFLGLLSFELVAVVLMFSIMAVACCVHSVTCLHKPCASITSLLK